MPPRALRFGVFELDRVTAELRKDGRRVRLPPQPARVLFMLASRAGDLVTREELQRDVWGAETFVDFEHGLNHCIKQIRAVLGDDADRPRFVETLPRRGYRFIAEVTPLTDAAGGPIAVVPAPVPRAVRPRKHSIVAAVAIVMAAAAGVAMLSREGSAPAGRVMVAVLPFEDLSAAPHERYFADGFTEEVIAQLGRFNPERVGVIGRTSAIRYRDARRSIAEISRELRVQYILEGTIRRADDRVRISAKLLAGVDEGHLWADTFDRDAHDVLSLQREVAEAIAARIRVALTPRTRKSGAPPIDPAVYDAYLKARYLFNKRLPDSIHAARGLFLEALRLDPTFASAHAGLGDVYLSTAGQPRAFRNALASADKALALDGNLAEAHATRAHALMHLYDWAGAAASLARAFELDPSYPQGRYVHAEYLAARGETQAAVEQARLGTATDPASGIAHHVHGVMLYYAGRHEDAIAAFRQARTLEPHHNWARVRLAMTLAELRRFDDALRELDGVNPFAAAYVQAVSGNLDAARRALAGDSSGHGAYTRAVVLAAMGERDAALAALEDAVTTGIYDTVYLKVDPRLRPLRGDARFASLLARVGLDR